VLDEVKNGPSVPPASTVTLPYNLPIYGVVKSVALKVLPEGTFTGALKAEPPLMLKVTEF